MLQNIRIVMVRPRGSGNIGSVARAMKNTGANDLAIVGKARTESFWARAMAVHGRDILADAKCLPNDPRSRRRLHAGGRHDVPCGTLSQSQPNRARNRADGGCCSAEGKVALILGPEDHGLSNKDLEHCQLLLTIPTHPDYQSLNVAQAAVICLYEFYVAALAPAQDSGIHRAEAENIERLFDIMRNVACSRSVFSTRKIPSTCCSRFGAFSDARGSKKKTCEY